MLKIISSLDIVHYAKMIMWRYIEMTINYRFDGEFFDYEIEYDTYLLALYKILREESKESLIDIITDADGCVLNLKEMFEEELKNYFEDKAYKEYLEGCEQ
jgi:hypothetical protein